MLITVGHGQPIKISIDKIRIHTDTISRARVAQTVDKSISIKEYLPKYGDIDESGSPTNLDVPSLGPRQVFRYLCKDAPETKHQPNINAKLEALAEAMTEHNDSVSANSNIPAIFTYFGQFVDHDITANTDRESSDIDASGFNIDQ